MRRFSQRSALVTLSEINITPLLDLAFVLLIIFVITTPLLDQGIKLPPGGKPDKPRLDKNDIRTVEVSSQGTYMIEHRRMLLDQIEAQLIKESRANPSLVVNLRADENSRWKEVEAMIDLCQRNGIKMSARTQPPKR